MDLYDEIDEKSLVGSRFMAQVANEIRRVASIEKAVRKITQQAIADKIGTSRAVVNREMQGLENLGARRIAELLWALGWEPVFGVRKIPAGENQHPCIKSEKPIAVATKTTDGISLLAPNQVRKAFGTTQTIKSGEAA
jgi:hypothetical protein